MPHEPRYTCVGVHRGVYPQVFGPSLIASMQRLFSHHWRVERRPNQFNPRITEVVLVRGALCPIKTPKPE